MDEKILEIIVKAKDMASRTLDKISDEVERQEKVWQRMSKSISKAGKIVTATAAAMAGALASTIPAWQETRKAQIAVENTFKNMPQLMDVNIQKWYEWVSAMEMKLAVDDAEINMMASKLGVYGLNEQQIKQMIPLIVDMSRKYGISLERAVRVVGYAFKGTTSRLEEFGIQLDISNFKTEEGIDKTALYNALLEQMGRSVSGVSQTMDQEGMLAMERFNLALGNLRETIGQVVWQTITPFMEKLNNLIIYFNQTSAPIAQFIAKVGIVGSALGLIIGPLMIVIGNLGKLASVITGLINPWTVLATTIIGLGVYLYKTNEQVRAFVDNIISQFAEIVNWVMNNWGTIYQVIKDTLIGIVQTVQPILQPFVDIVKSIFGQVIDWVQVNMPLIKQTVETIFNAIKTVIDTIMQAILWIWQNYGEQIKANWDALWSIIYTVVETAIQLILNGLKVFMQLITGDWSGMSETIKNTWSMLWEAVLTIGQNLWTMIYNALIVWGGLLKKGVQATWDAIKTGIQAFADNTRNIWEPWLQHLKAVWEKVWSALKPFMEPILIGIRGTIQAITQLIHGDWQGAWETMKETTREALMAIAAAIKGAIGNITNAVKGIASSIRNVFTNLAKEAYQWGVNMIKMLINGIKSKIHDLYGWVEGIADKIKSMLGFHSPPKEGPLSDSDQWMPRMLTMFAEGIQKKERILDASINRITNKFSRIGEVITLPEEPTPISMPLQTPTGILTQTDKEPLPVNLQTEGGPARSGGEDAGTIANAVYQSIIRAFHDMDFGREDRGEIILQIDGQAFARLIYNHLLAESKRRGVEVIPV